MKGGGGGKEPPVEGEVSGKRPKRKCLQWHPLLAKKAPDFSEEEEEEDEEELEKVGDIHTLKTAYKTNGTSSSTLVCRCKVDKRQQQSRKCYGVFFIASNHWINIFSFKIFCCCLYSVLSIMWHIQVKIMLI